MQNNLDVALSRIIDLLQLEETENLVNTLVDLLEVSAGTDLNGDKHYRYYYVVALQLWLGIENNLLEGESAKFNENRETTRRYLIIQSLLDEEFKLFISDNFRVEALIDATVPDEKKINFPGIISF